MAALPATVAALTATPIVPAVDAVEDVRLTRAVVCALSVGGARSRW
jgi:hypothetical protein